MTRKNKVTLKLLITLGAVGAALLGLLYITSPRHFPECQGTEVPRHCVDL